MSRKLIRKLFDRVTMFTSSANQPFQISLPVGTKIINITESIVVSGVFYDFDIKKSVRILQLPQFGLILVICFYKRSES